MIAASFGWTEAMDFALREDTRALHALADGDIEGARILLESAEAAQRAARLAFEAAHDQARAS